MKLILSFVSANSVMNPVLDPYDHIQAIVHIANWFQAPLTGKNNISKLIIKPLFLKVSTW